MTAGGLVFIAGTKDERIHAFDKQTGRAPLGTPPAGRRLRDPRDLSGERPPVRRHRRRRRRQAADEGGRCVRGVLSGPVSVLEISALEMLSRRGIESCESRIIDRGATIGHRRARPTVSRTVGLDPSRAGS